MTIGSRAEVWHGKADKTAGGLVKGDLMLGKKDGAIKSKAQVAAAKKNPGLKQWRAAVDQAKKKLKIPKKGEFVPISGKVLTETRKIFAKKK
jgi:hypothetical protein